MGDVLRIDLVAYDSPYDSCGGYGIDLEKPFLVVSDRAFSGSVAQGEFSYVSAPAPLGSFPVIPATFSQRTLHAASDAVANWFEAALVRAGFTTGFRNWSDIRANKVHLAELDRMDAWLWIRYGRIHEALATLDTSRPNAARTQMLLRMAQAVLEAKAYEVDKSRGDLQRWLSDHAE